MIPDDLQNYGIAETAKILGCFPRFLEDNLHRFPHQKLGAAVGFDFRDMAEIKEICRVRPSAVPAPAEAPRNLREIRPAASRRRKTA
jgi:hypothetical protein